MNTLALIRRCAAEGVRLWVEDGRLRFRTVAGVMLSPEARARLTTERAALIALLNEGELTAAGLPAGVAWRIDAMRAGIPAAGPIPFLVAKRDLLEGADGCLSCGNGRAPGSLYRCAPCIEAAQQVVASRRLC